jgi:predicted transcriptional regulator
LNLPKYLEDVKRLYDQNKDIEEIGSILGVKPETVRRYIYKINNFEKENIIKKIENKEKTINEINELQDYKEQTKY